MPRRSKSETKRDYWTAGEGLVQIKEWVEQGLYDKQIAKNIGIAPKTLIEWRKTYEVFDTVFVKARGVALVELVNATFKAAKGYYVNEQVLDDKGNKRLVRKWVPGNSADRIFLLKNWDPENYRDKRDFGVEGAIPVVLTGDDEIED